VKLRVNGEDLTYDDPATVAALLQRLGHDPAAVAVAVNLTFVPRREYETKVLNAGDDIEIVAPMQGG
jgi:thiamine biosynthesis protein ThiS